MSKLADQLRGIRLFNNYDLLKRFGAAGDVAIEYHRPAEGRMGWCEAHRTTVWSPLPHAKLGAARKDATLGGEKEFIGNRAETFQLAVNWAMAEFGHDYVPSPFGGYIPDHIRHKAKAAIKTAE